MYHYLFSLENKEYKFLTNQKYKNQKYINNKININSIDIKQISL